eukprot:UN16939
MYFTVNEKDNGKHRHLT